MGWGRLQGKPHSSNSQIYYEDTDFESEAEDRYPSWDICPWWTLTDTCELHWLLDQMTLEDQYKRTSGWFPRRDRVLHLRTDRDTKQLNALDVVLCGDRLVIYTRSRSDSGSLFSGDLSSWRAGRFMKQLFCWSELLFLNAGFTGSLPTASCFITPDSSHVLPAS